MTPQAIKNVAQKLPPWLAKADDGNGIILSTRFSYIRKFNGDAGKRKRSIGSQDILNGISKCGLWDKATLFHPELQPSLSSIIADKFLVKKDIASNPKGVTAVFKDSFDEICIFNNDSKLKIYKWISGLPTQEDFQAFKNEVHTLERNIEGVLENQDTITGKFGTVLFLNLPAFTISQYNKQLNAIQKFNFKIKPVFDFAEKASFYALSMVKPGEDASAAISGLNEAADLVKSAEEDIRSFILKHNINGYFNAVNGYMRSMKRGNCELSYGSSLNMLSLLWLAADYGMLPQNTIPKIKRAISATSDTSVLIISGNTRTTVHSLMRCSEIKRIFDENLD
ncbi:MAG: hypothetical protein IJS08_15240 [Victivallales bacterium]|nr:hypothetical protein [Victivallales bacterium]